MKIATPEWNDEMYRQHATPYGGLAGFVEHHRVGAILKRANVSPDDQLLEVGCEAGGLLSQFPKCKRVVGFDISQAALMDAKSLFKRKGISAEFFQGDASEPLPFNRGEFSVIVCSEMLEHVPDPGACIESIARIADRHTRIILTVPYERPKLVVKAALRRLGLMKILMPGIEQKQSEWHLQQFDQHKLRHICDGKLEILRLDCILGLHWIAVCRALASDS